MQQVRGIDTIMEEVKANPEVEDLTEEEIFV